MENSNFENNASEIGTIISEILYAAFSDDGLLKSFSSHSEHNIPFIFPEELLHSSPLDYNALINNIITTLSESGYINTDVNLEEIINNDNENLNNEQIFRKFLIRCLIEHYNPDSSSMKSTTLKFVITYGNDIVKMIFLPSDELHKFINNHENYRGISAELFNNVKNYFLGYNNASDFLNINNTILNIYKENQENSFKEIKNLADLSSFIEDYSSFYFAYTSDPKGLNCDCDSKSLEKYYNSHNEIRDQISKKILELSYPNGMYPLERNLKQHAINSLLDTNIMHTNNYDISVLNNLKFRNLTKKDGSRYGTLIIYSDGQRETVLNIAKIHNQQVKLIQPKGLPKFLPDILRPNILKKNQRRFIVDGEILLIDPTEKPVIDTPLENSLEDIQKE